jgi:hypothetical protein
MNILTQSKLVPQLMRKLLSKKSSKIFYSNEFKSYNFNDFYEHTTNTPTDLIILNSPNFPHFFQNLWNISKNKICADGGCNRLFQYSKE